jgi:hypothetical protein
MNSTFYGDAVREQSKWLKPTGSVNDVEKPLVQIFGQKLNTLTPRQIQLCPNEKERFQHPFELKKKKYRRRTIFPKHGSTGHIQGD